MEQEKGTPIDDGLNEYRVYEHPLLPKRIVKIGICWPALIVGPAYLIYRRLWVPVVVWIVAIGIARYIVNDNYQPIFLEEKETVEQIMDGIMFFCSVVLLFITNSLWEKDLIKRGYTITKSRRARSMDDFLAILASEITPTRPL